MGEAKRRGDYDTRKKLAVERNIAQSLRRKGRQLRVPNSSKQEVLTAIADTLQTTNLENIENKQ